MAREMEQLKMDKLNQTNSNSDNIKGKEKEMDSRKGWNSIGSPIEQAWVGGRQGQDQSDQASTSSYQFKTT